MSKIDIKSWIEESYQDQEDQILEHVEENFEDYLEESKAEILRVIREARLYVENTDIEWQIVKDAIMFSARENLSIGRHYYNEYRQVSLTSSIGEYQIDFPWRLTPTRADFLSRHTDGLFDVRDQTCTLHASPDHVVLDIDLDTIRDFLEYFDSRGKRL